MNKAELISKMAEESKLTKKATEAALAAFTTSVEAALKAGEKVQLVGFGTFEVRQRAARKGRNPQTKAEIKIPASKAPAFKAGKALKDKVNNR
ncbi:MAG: HU family DNA-binding protein [Clostridia bacterium]